jgi:cathepsin B
MSSYNVTLPAAHDFLAAHPLCDFGPLSQECGRCCASGPLKAMSHRFCRALGRQVLLSSQFVVSCDLADNGCERSVFHFMEQRGITDASCHPWRGKTTYDRRFCESCASGAPMRLYRAAHASTARFVGTDDIKKAIILEGPVSASIAIDPGFARYRGGIYRSSLRRPVEAGNHAVEIVGWGIEKGEQFWIISNQYGKAWGEGGKMRIRMGTNEGLIEGFVYAATPLIEGQG